MRLTDQEIQSIKSSILKLDPKAKIYLYGSRTKDELKGGDIDLLVVSETLQWKDKITVLTDLTEELGEQKIDILIQSQSELKTDPFFESIKIDCISIE